MVNFFLLYLYIVVNGLILLFISYRKVIKNQATKYYFFQYIILLLLVTEFFSMRYLYTWFDFFSYPDFPIRFLLTPFIYLYVSSYLNPNDKPSSKVFFLLFTPALLELCCFIYISVYFYNNPTDIKTRFNIANATIYYYSRTILALLFNIFCSYLAIRKINYFTTQSQKVLSDTSILKYSWLEIILKITFYLLLLWAVAFVLEMIYSYNAVFLYYAYNFIYICIAVVLLIFGYISVLKPYLPSAYVFANQKIIEIDPIEESATNQFDAKSDVKVETTNELEIEEVDLYSSDEIATLKKNWLKLEEYIVEKQIYTKLDITLQEIAIKLNTTTYNLSKAIKIYSTKDNFYDYINYYRVQLFLQLLQSGKFENYTIQFIGIKAGFSSTTTLTKYCKKYLGSTPAELIKLTSLNKN